MKRTLKIMFCLSMFAMPNFAANVYEFQHGDAGQKVLIVGLIHSYGNDEIDRLAEPSIKTMATRILRLHDKRKTLHCYYELNLKGAEHITDVAVKALYDEGKVRDNVIAYDPRSEWTVFAEGFEMQLEVYPKMTGRRYNQLSSKAGRKILSLVEFKEQLAGERDAILLWQDNDDRKSLLNEFEKISQQLEVIAPQTFAELFFDSFDIRDTLVSYHYHLADLAFFNKVIESRDDITLIIGDSHAKELGRMLESVGFNKTFMFDKACIGAGIGYTKEDLVKIFQNASDVVEERYAQFVLGLERNRFCKVCFAAESPAQKISKCGKCRNHHYCSAQCQRSDWPHHKKTCNK